MNPPFITFGYIFRIFKVILILMLLIFRLKTSVVRVLRNNQFDWFRYDRSVLKYNKSEGLLISE
jgi:hypothetical protein